MFLFYLLNHDLTNLPKRLSLLSSWDRRPVPLGPTTLTSQWQLTAKPDCPARYNVLLLWFL